MGIGVSSWRLARRVAQLGEIGVVSGTSIDTVMVRELQEGDPHDRRIALQDYPDREIVDYILDRFYVEGGKAHDAPYRLLPIHRFKPKVRSQRILSAATFSEVRLAKEGHDGLIGINMLGKLKRYTLAGLYGAMLASVDKVFIGAGIPTEEAKQIPKLAAGEPARLRLNVDTSQAPDDVDGPFYYELDPADLIADPPTLPQPDFYPIISSDVLARILDKKLPDGLIAGWVIEGPVAGGHNAPPRNKRTDDDGHPIYDERDIANLDQVAALGYPFYLAGGYGSPDKLRDALDRGAAGIQVGSLFSLAEESGYPAEATRRLIRAIHADELSVRTDGRVSPTGFPFKVLDLEGTLAESNQYENRTRICDLGYLRTPYLDKKGRLQGRCPGEPVDDYVRKGGNRNDTEERGCLCNALCTNIGLGQQQKWGTELPLFTGGDALLNLPLGSVENPRYTAEDVIDYLYGEHAVPTEPSVASVSNS